MRSYQEWCEHYDYDPDSQEAQRDYQRYRQQLQLLSGLDRPKPDGHTDSEPLEQEP